MSELLNAVESVVLGPIAGPVVSALQTAVETIAEPTAPLFSASDAEATSAIGGQIEAILGKIQTAAKGGYYWIQVLALSEGQQTQLESLGYRIEPVLDSYGQVAAVAGLTGPGRYTQYKILWGKAAQQPQQWDPSKAAAALSEAILQARDSIGSPRTIPQFASIYTNEPEPEAVPFVVPRTEPAAHVLDPELAKELK